MASNRNKKNSSGKIIFLRKFFGKPKEATPVKQKKSEPFFSGERRFNILFGAGVLIAATMLFVRTGDIAPSEFHEGEVSRKNVFSPADMLVEDVLSTALNRKNSYDSIEDVYDLNLETLRVITDRIHGAFTIMKNGYMKESPQAYQFVLRDLEESEIEEIGSRAGEQAKKRREYQAQLHKFQSGKTFEELEKRFKETIGINLSQKTIKVLRWHRYDPQIADYLSTILAELMQRGISQQKDFLPETSRKGITVHNTDSGKMTGSVHLGAVYDMREAISFSRSRIKELVAPQHPSLRRESLKTLKQFIQPNLSYNKTKTVDLKSATRDAVSPVYFQLKKGELIVRKGERITSEQIVKLGHIMAEIKKGSRFQSIAGMALFILLIVGISSIYLRLFMKEFVSSRSNIILLGLIFVAEVALLRFFGAGAEVFTAGKSDIALGSYLYAAPFAVAPLLAAIFFTREITILVTLATALSAGMLYPDSPHYIWMAMAGGLLAVFNVGRIKRRTDVWGVGFALMGTSTLVVVVGDMLDNILFTQQSMHNILSAMLGALLVVALTLTLLPLIERLFPVVSDIKLRELLDLNHPLLAKMAVVAPGTYHHSVLVGNIAEEAAEAIGANPLLTRVGAYFHDVGKMDKPEYFIENQQAGANKHDNLNPSMSALILISHVTRGLDMAREHKLIPQVRDMISEHHGTQIIQYFYQRAKEQEKPGMTAVKEHDFRYTGGKPRTRESAIVALADSVEAASKTLKNPTSARLSQLVFKIINNRFMEGELDQSHLTLYDLKKIGNSFVRILSGIFHQRIEYPEEKLDGEDTGNIQGGDQRPERFENKDKTAKNIKRIK